MDAIVSTPTPGGPTGARKALEQHHIQFQGFIFGVIIFSDQEITISFNQISTSKVHEACCIKLENINYKTVLAALKKEHGDVISASLKYTQDHYSLHVEVKYDFLPPIVQIINFAPRVIADKEMSELEIKNYFHEIKLLKEEVANISNCQVLVVPLKGSLAQGKIAIPKFNTLVTWSIEATSGLSNNTIRISVSYVNSRTGQVKKTNFLPADQVSVYSTTGSGSIEMRFLIKPVEGYDTLSFKVDQNLQGKMLITKERV